MSQTGALAQQEKKNFDFIDAIRCIAMMGIVFEHAVYYDTYLFATLTPRNLTYISLLQLPKFGTAAFFVLAGFLLGDKFHTYTPGEYFKRRIASTIKPWLIWSLIFVAVMFLKTWLTATDPGSFAFLPQLLHVFERVYLYTNYWFIINFLICIGILLLFRRHLYSNGLGAALLLCSLAYGLNAHFVWFMPQHTTAVFGFVFFLWLGAKLHIKWLAVKSFLNKIPHVVFALLACLTFWLALEETKVLFHARSVDPYNTLRISNTLYALVVIGWMLKVERFGFTRVFHPRQTTYGIYLIHYIIVYGVVDLLFLPFHFPRFPDLSLIEMILFAVARFVVVYGITWVLVGLIGNSRFKWAIGR